VVEAAPDRGKLGRVADGGTRFVIDISNDATPLLLKFAPREAELTLDMFARAQALTASPGRARRRLPGAALLARRALEPIDVVTLVGEAMEIVPETLVTANCITNRRLRTRDQQ
jgi:hypothetical protein